MPGRVLLDVNLRIALLDEAHAHNRKACALMKRPGLRIATCPLIENAVLRVLNLPGYSPFGAPGFEPGRVNLDEICRKHDHAFWPDDVSMRSERLVDWSRVRGHNLISDVYLLALALAVAHGACFATLDHWVALSAVPAASEKHLMLL